VAQQYLRRIVWLLPKQLRSCIRRRSTERALQLAWDKACAEAEVPDLENALVLALVVGEQAALTSQMESCADGGKLAPYDGWQQYC